MFYNILIVYVNILGLLLKILIENFSVVKYFRNVVLLTELYMIFSVH